MRTARVSALVFISGIAAALAAPVSASDIVVANDQRRSYDCAGGSLTVTGGSNVLTLHNCSRLLVNGGENTIDAGLVDSIEVGGADNKITWTESPDGRKPRIANTGGDNVIVSKPAPAGAAVRPAAPVAAAPAPAASPSISVRSGSGSQVTVAGDKVKVQGADGTVTVAGNGTVTVKNNAAAPTVAGDKIRVDKDGQKLTIDCRGSALLVNGDHNDVSAQNCSEIRLNGNDNRVTWSAPGGSHPQIADNGKGNTVSGQR